MALRSTYLSVMSILVFFVSFLSVYELAAQEAGGVASPKGEPSNSESDLLAAPCDQSEAQYVVLKKLDHGISYKKCWHSAKGKFVTQVYKNSSIVHTHEIPSQLEVTGQGIYTKAVDAAIEKKIRRIQKDREKFREMAEAIGRVDVSDFNFDGEPDILIYKGEHEDPLWKYMSEPGDQNQWVKYKVLLEDKTIPHNYYDGLIWNTSTGGFEAEPELYSIADPVVSSKAQTITIIRNVPKSKTSGLVFELGEDDDDAGYRESNRTQSHRRYYREFVRLKYVNKQFLYDSAVSFVSCGQYSAEYYPRDSGPEEDYFDFHKDNHTCLYSEFSYKDDREHRVKAYVPVEQLSDGWPEYIQKHAPRKPMLDWK
ncbi:MAG: hypothetical protein J6A01_01285 [Proteobacteria bacterium]|nr:hypothetical protein [Pseudomonadota bacterium]